MRWIVAGISAVALGSGACGDGAGSADATGADTGRTDGAVESESESESEVESETANPDVVAAVPGARCALADRIGLVELYLLPGPTGMVDVRASVSDRPNPWYGAPALTNQACAYHAFKPTGACPPCNADELCGIDGTCTRAPVKHTDARLTLTTSTDSEAFDADDVTGDIYGMVTLPGRTFGLDLAFAGHHVTLVASEIPGELAGATGSLAGTYDHPTGLDIRWTPVSDGSDGSAVFTHIPINHHAGGPTFTECTAPATAGTFHVDEGMLVPLAVSTGLEFQGIEHARFAAAETPWGCVEFHYAYQQYVNLGF